MCGRLDISIDLIAQPVEELTDTSLSGSDNADLKPTEGLEILIRNGEDLELHPAQWGVQPAWSDKLLINARSETLLEKSTFREAFRYQRCIVPCSGWYEWKRETGTDKVKYRFSALDGGPLYIAGLYFRDEAAEADRLSGNKPVLRVVTLTQAPSNSYSQYHHRMPLIFAADALPLWFFTEAEQLQPQLVLLSEQEFKAEANRPNKDQFDFGFEAF